MMPSWTFKVIFVTCFVDFVRHDVLAVPRAFPRIQDTAYGHSQVLMGLSPDVAFQELAVPAPQGHQQQYSEPRQLPPEFQDHDHQSPQQSVGALRQQAWDNEQDIPIRRQYKQLIEYSKEPPKGLDTSLFSKESKEKFSGEVDENGEPVIISHNYKEHKLSQKERQKIFEAPYNLLSPPEAERTAAGGAGAGANYNLYYISSPFRRKDFRLPKDPLVLEPAAAADHRVPYEIRAARRPSAAPEDARFSDDHDPGVDTRLIHRPTTRQKQLPVPRRRRSHRGHGHGVRQVVNLPSLT